MFLLAIVCMKILIRSCCADEDVYGKSLDYVETVISKLPGASVRLGFISPQCGSYCIVNLERRGRQSNELHEDTNDNPLLHSGEYMQRPDAIHANPLAASGQTIYRRSLSPASPYFQALPMRDWLHARAAPYSPRQIAPLIESPMQMHMQDTLRTLRRHPCSCIGEQTCLNCHCGQAIENALRQPPT